MYRKINFKEWMIGGSEIGTFFGNSEFTPVFKGKLFEKIFDF